MFPLEHTVLPTAITPLHIFEPRYRQLANDLTRLDEPEFGIVPIERGREVGGEDVRANVGVVARIVHHEEFPDGRWAIVALATRRIEVAEWLEDRPYPRAVVKDRVDIQPAGENDAARPGDVDVHLERGFRRVATAVARLMPDRELPEWTQPTWELPSDRSQAIWTACVAAQVGPFDAARLLAIDDVAERGTLAARLIEERADVLEALADERG